MCGSLWSSCSRMPFVAEKPTSPGLDPLEPTRPGPASRHRQDRSPARRSRQDEVLSPDHKSLLKKMGTREDQPDHDVDVLGVADFQSRLDKMETLEDQPGPE